MLFSHLFHFEIEHTAQDRKKILLQRLGKNKEILNNLPLLNRVFDIDLPQTDHQSQLSGDELVMEMTKSIEVGCSHALYVRYCRWIVINKAAVYMCSCI